MEENKHIPTYVAPEIRSVYVYVEQGFSGSGQIGTNPMEEEAADGDLWGN